MAPQLTIGHSPDPDDAFMFYGFATGKVTIRDFTLTQISEDIESLNKRAMSAELDVTAISAAVYPFVHRQYRIMSTGASVGRRYGPRLVTRTPMRPHDLLGRSIAVPGRNTTAFMALRLALKAFETVEAPFDQIPAMVKAGDVDAGLIIHESQLTYEREGLHLVLDLGAWWYEQTDGLPLPLGLDVVHRRHDADLAAEIRQAFEASIRLAYQEKEAALDYALQFGRGLDRETGWQFIQMYVNYDTVRLGRDGIKALETLYRWAYEHALIGSLPVIDPV